MLVLLGLQEWGFPSSNGMSSREDLAEARWVGKAEVGKAVFKFGSFLCSVPWAVSFWEEGERRLFLGPAPGWGDEQARGFCWVQD